MSVSDSLIMELEQEGKTTRALLARIPADKLTWKPHEKSMTLGRLALHVAFNPGGIAEIVQKDTVAVEELTPVPEPESAEAILAKFEEGLDIAKKILREMDDDAMRKFWCLTRGGKPIVNAPRAGIIRFMAFNHLYHHRGQLSVYLRLLNVPLPPIYGPSADEAPYA